MYNATVAQQTRTVALEVLGTLFVWWLAGAWRLGAMLLFLGFVFLTFMELLHLIAMRQGTANLMKDVSPDELDEHRETIKWLNKAELVRWVSLRSNSRAAGVALY